jgi:hypothetical protein
MTETVTMIRPPALLDLRSARDAQSFEAKAAPILDAWAEQDQARIEAWKRENAFRAFTARSYGAVLACQGLSQPRRATNG